MECVFKCVSVSLYFSLINNFLSFRTCTKKNTFHFFYTKFHLIAVICIIVSHNELKNRFLMSEQGPPQNVQQPGPPPPGPNMPPGPPGQQGAPGQENLNALQRAIDSMEEKGLQEDPRFVYFLIFFFVNLIQFFFSLHFR